jgi:hypothetical protein
MASPILLFGLKVSNGDAADYPEVGQLIAAPGTGVPGGSLIATMEHQDASTGRWITDPLLPPTPQPWWWVNVSTTALGRGATLLTAYRLTLQGVHGNGGTTVLHGIVIDERLHTVLAEATVPLCTKL